MDDATALLGLLIATAVFGVLLILASAAAFGRILADLEYQYAAGLNGVRRIQSKINLRTHGNRIGLGLFALVTSILTLATVDLVWRTWIGRALFMTVLTSYTIASILDWLDERKQVRLLLVERDRQGPPRSAVPRAEPGLTGTDAPSSEEARP